MIIVGKTDIGRSRDENQDTYRSGQIREVAAWGLVCDGMGGAQNGRLASVVAADCVEGMLYRQLQDPQGKTPKDIQEDAIRLANAEVFTRSGEGEAMMGTTVVCTVISGGKAHIAHVGDSRAYLFKNGELEQVTHDHSMVQEMVDMGTITSAEAAHHPERNVITRALGVEEDVQADFTSLTLEDGDIILMCSDGLTNMVAFEEIARLMRESDIHEMAGTLVAAALAAGGDDNVTVLAMRADAGD